MSLILGSIPITALLLQKCKPRKYKIVLHSMINT